MDIVGFSKLPSDNQNRIVSRLQHLVRESNEYRKSREAEQVISLPTGDGMALAFFNRLDAALQCAVEVMNAIRAEELCSIRMGVHTGPVFVMEDINNKLNISGAGINKAERVMSCGADGHILLSDNVGESLSHLTAWQGKIHAAGECQVKDGWIRVWNFTDGTIGNPALPMKSKSYLQRRRRRKVGALAAAFVLAAGLVGGASFWMGRLGKSGSSPLEASVAVLPFADMSLEKNQQFFSDGIAEELLNGLSTIHELRVAARTSSFVFKNAGNDPRVIGEKLNVATILEGSVRIQGKRCRISVRLIKAADGFQLWAQTFDRDMNDIFLVQDEIARAVIEALKGKLLKDTPPAPAKTTSAEAYTAYLQGRYFYGRRDKEHLERAVSYFEQAIQLDPTYSPAWVGLGETHSRQADLGYLPFQEGFRKAREAIERALVLDPNLGDAHAALGWMSLTQDWNWTGADSSFKKALALEPGNVIAIQGAGALARVLGHLDEAIAQYRRAIAVDPLNSVAYADYGLVLQYAGRNEEAKAAFLKALEISPEMVRIHCMLGEILLAQSQPQAALSEMEKEKHQAFHLYGVALAYHALGRNKDADASLADLIRKLSAVAPFQIAEVYAFRGDANRAFEWLDRAYFERDPGITQLKGAPLFRDLVGDPRFAGVLNKLRLPA